MPETNKQKTEPDTDRADGAAKPAADGIPAESGRNPAPVPSPAPEVGGRGGADLTRYGDWEINGRCVDF